MDQEKAKKLFDTFKQIKDVLISKKNPQRMQVYMELGNLLKKHGTSGAALADLMKEGGVEEWKTFDVMDGDTPIADYLLEQYEKMKTTPDIELPETPDVEGLRSEVEHFAKEALAEKSAREKEEIEEKTKEETLDPEEKEKLEKEKENLEKIQAAEKEKITDERQQKIDALKTQRKQMFGEGEMMEFFDRMNAFYGYVKQQIPEANLYDGWHVLMSSSANAKNQENMSTGAVSLEGDVPAPYSTEQYMKAERMRNGLKWLERMGKKEELLKKIDSELEEESPEKRENLLMYKIAHGEDVYMETAEKKNGTLENSDQGEESEKIYEKFLDEWTNPELQENFQQFKKEWRGATYRDAVAERDRILTAEKERIEQEKRAAAEATKRALEQAEMQKENDMPPKEDDNELPTPHFPMR